MSYPEVPCDRSHDGIIDSVSTGGDEFLLACPDSPSFIEDGNDLGHCRLEGVTSSKEVFPESTSQLIHGNVEPGKSVKGTIWVVPVLVSFHMLGVPLYRGVFDGFPEGLNKVKVSAFWVWLEPYFKYRESCFIITRH